MVSSIVRGAEYGSQTRRIICSVINAGKPKGANNDPKTSGANRIRVCGKE